MQITELTQWLGILAAAFLVAIIIIFFLVLVISGGEKRVKQQALKIKELENDICMLENEKLCIKRDIETYKTLNLKLKIELMDSIKKVRIFDWDEMVEECGIDEDGDIASTSNI